VTKLITEQEQRAYRLCHHEFEGLTVEQAAKVMKVHVATIYRLLDSLKQKTPQLFPILSQYQWTVYKMFVDEGLPQHRIAEKFGVTREDITQVLQRIKDKGVPGLNLGGINHPLSFTPEMDNHIIRKF